RFQIGDVRADRLLPDIAQWADTNRAPRWTRTHIDPRLAIGIGCREADPVAAAGGVGQYDLTGLRRPRRHVVEARPAELKAAQALEAVVPPRAITAAMGHRLAELTATWDVNTERLLPAHDGAHCVAQFLPKGILVGRRTGLAGAVGFDQRVGTWQAADMTRQDTAGAGPHYFPQS